MKSILKVVSLFAVVLFVSLIIIGCGGSSKDPITGLYQPPAPTAPADVTPEGVPTSDPTIDNNVKNVENIPATYTNYQIVSLHFASHLLNGDNMDATFTIDGNNKAYSFVIGIKDTDTNQIAYFAIDGSQWNLNSSDNPEVSEQNGKLTVSASFYSDRNASISLEVNYKGLPKTFTFVLATNLYNEVVERSVVRDGITYNIIRYDVSNPNDPRNMSAPLDPSVFSLGNEYTIANNNISRSQGSINTGDNMFTIFKSVSSNVKSAYRIGSLNSATVPDGGTIDFYINDSPSPVNYFVDYFSGSGTDAAGYYLYIFISDILSITESASSFTLKCMASYKGLFGTNFETNYTFRD